VDVSPLQRVDVHWHRNGKEYIEHYFTEHVVPLFHSQVGRYIGRRRKSIDW
jgi:hypothetical protein